MLLVDLRGHGQSDWIPPAAGGASALPYQPAGYAEDVVGLLRQLDVENAVLVGSSLGGLVAIVVAAECAERVAGVCLVDPPLDYVDGPLLSLFRQLREAKLKGPAAIAQTLAGDAPPRQPVSKRPGFSRWFA